VRPAKYTPVREKGWVFAVPQLFLFFSVFTELPRRCEAVEKVFVGENDSSKQAQNV
jgi:hypothetical protein